MINWNYINRETKKYLSKQLCTIDLEEYIYLGNSNFKENMINTFNKSKTIKTNDENLVDKESLIGNLIE